MGAQEIRHEVALPGEGTWTRWDLLWWCRVRATCVPSMNFMPCASRTEPAFTMNIWYVPWYVRSTQFNSQVSRRQIWPVPRTRLAGRSYEPSETPTYSNLRCCAIRVRMTTPSKNWKTPRTQHYFWQLPQSFWCGCFETQEERSSVPYRPDKPTLNATIYCRRTGPPGLRTVPYFSSLEEGVRDRILVLLKSRFPTKHVFLRQDVQVAVFFRTLRTDLARSSGGGMWSLLLQSANSNYVHVIKYHTVASYGSLLPRACLCLLCRES